MNAQHHDPPGDPFERIRATDPVTDPSYAHADGAAMVDRIVAVTRRRSARRGRVAVLAPVSAAIAAGITALGLLVAPAATTSPSLLALTPTAAKTWTQVGVGEKEAQYGLNIVTNASAAFAAPAPAPATYEYELGGALTSAVPTDASYPATASFDPTALLAAYAGHLGVPGRVVGGASGWHVRVATPTGASTATLERDRTTGLYEFALARTDHTAAGCPMGTATAAPIVDRAATEASVSRVLTTFGLGYALGEPRFEAAPALGCDRPVTLGEQILVGGIPTDLSVSATFDRQGDLVAAAFPVFAVGQPTALQLVSAASAASALARRSTARDLGYSIQGDAELHAARYGDLSQVPADLTTVEIRSATTALRAFLTNDGTWLLPVYELTGDAYSSMLRPGSAPWSGAVLATSPHVVAVRGGRGGWPALFDQSLP